MFTYDAKVFFQHYMDKKPTNTKVFQVVCQLAVLHWVYDLKNYIPRFQANLAIYADHMARLCGVVFGRVALDQQHGFLWDTYGGWSYWEDDICLS
jgi:hypothetical protein